MCNLTDLEITVEGDLGQKATSSLAALFQYIPKLIRRLKSVFHGVIGQPAISFPAFIRSFLSLQVIATIDISFYHYIPSISDADLSLIAESWPQLEQLKIHPFRDHVRSTLLRPTASGIIDLARRCSQLKSLLRAKRAFTVQASQTHFAEQTCTNSKQATIYGSVC
ncbi:hypothetical protein OH76DRAFT_1484682 [Lentinus brumalis]|uniref:F-box domain-containing protein n=1 Tax=Lentinus brumalis TaxID=2498619 RepID=A0A371D4U2_9APHY|nr:hypothetical protein OH76DRAFT_1484682 [Polyporus brumalis]